MKNLVVYLIGAALVGASIFAHAYMQRYEVAGTTSGLFVRLDKISGRLSACTQIEPPVDSVAAERIVALTSAGFRSEEIEKYLTEMKGRMICSAWNE